MRAEPQVFIAIEQTMAAALHKEWDKIAVALLDKVHPLLAARDWQGAHHEVSRLSLNDMVKSIRPKLIELAVSAVVFGAHHVAGDMGELAITTAGTQLRNNAIDGAINLLETHLEQDAADYIRVDLHKLIAEFEQQDETSHVQKDDISDDELAQTGGLKEPEQAGPKKKKRIRKGEKTLYVNRPLLNVDDLHAWLHTQGFKSVQLGDDIHVTVCYSKTPFDWDFLLPDEDPVKVIEGERKFEQFGDATVLTFSSDELQHEHSAFMDAGASYDFPSYRPHITLTWEGAPRPLDELEPYRGPLVFGPQEFAPINDDWKEEHEELTLRKAETSSLAERLNQAVLTGGKVHASTSANLTTSRLVSLGFLAQAVDAGAEEYEVNEVLDEKTCPVCVYMHGRRFKVSTEYSRLMQTLQTDDPQELKSLAPWPGQSKAAMADLKGQTEGEMQAGGLGSPPYHPGCRGMLALVGTVEPHEPLGGIQWQDDEEAGLAAALGEGENPEWPEEKTASLQDAIDSIQDEGVAATAQDLFDAGSFDEALTAAEDYAANVDETAFAVSEVTEGVTWDTAAVDKLRWEQFEVTDPEEFVGVNAAFEEGKYDEAQKLIDDWKSEHVEKEDITEGPNAGTKKKRQQAAHREQAYDDIHPDSSDGSNVQIANDVNAPIDSR